MNLPNKLTLARIALVPFFVAAMLLPGMGYWAAALFAIASLTDYLDGHIARTRNLVTDFGKLMDPIADKLLVMAALIGLVAKGIANPVCVMVILGREFVMSGLRMVALQKGVVIAAGMLGKIKTVMQMIGILMALVAEPMGIAWVQVGASALLWLSAAMAAWSLVDYMLRNKGVIA